MVRAYQLRQRAAKQEETKQRIVEATVALHTSIGPARTSIKGIAELAGVERLTVYRHFPDLQSLFKACAAHSSATDPLPDPGAFREGSAADRLRTALAAQYAYYARNEQGVAAILRDSAVIHVGRGYFRQWDAMTEALLPGWNTRGARRGHVHAVIRHALEFATWQSLVKTGRLPAGQAVELMLALVGDAAGSRPG
jgi:AcrR family transcriptional regulator